MKDEIKDVIKSALKEHGIEDMPADFAVEINGRMQEEPILGGHPLDIFWAVWQVAMQTLKDVDIYAIKSGKKSEEPVFSVREDGSLINLMGKPIYEIIPF